MPSQDDSHRHQPRSIPLALTRLIEAGMTACLSVAKCLLSRIS
jgi:hypothetical protein